MVDFGWEKNHGKKECLGNVLFCYDLDLEMFKCFEIVLVASYDFCW